VTSYTRLTAERARGRAPRGGLGADDAASDRLEREPGLRSARSSGVFLHELLERVPLAAFAEHPALDDWRRRPDVVALVDEAMAVHRVAAEEQAHAERMVWTAYTTPVTLHGGGRLEGIARAARVAREMPFVYPIAQGGRVFVRGSLDLAFEHEGRTYFVDWKSDTLPSYGSEALQRRVADHYDAQRKLYALAIAKLLGISGEPEHEERFGGILYCFLRGFGSAGQGLWSERPSWRELSAWADEVRGWGRTP
jgi:exodeoxyribonuclease V beta subunit